MASSSSFSSFVPLLILLAVAVESRPSPEQDNKQVLHSLFGSHLSSIILASPTSDDVTEGSSGYAAPSSYSSSPSAGLAVSRGAARVLTGKKEAVPRFFLEFLQRQAKTRRRSRKSMMASSSSFSSFVPLLILLAVAVESRPSPEQDNKQVLHSLFGSHLSSIILASPTSDDVTEGSSGYAAPSSYSSSPSAGLAVSRGAARVLTGKKEAVPRFFLEFLQRQAKTRRRSRKSMVGGRGCFGMKMDRIGSISGLGC
ncbi:putative C-type natriuretic peptide 2-like [Scophthalmus maximus]|nr:putative C-type natriuretic peptide 2-like [Scophthalmus maximus]